MPPFGPIYCETPAIIGAFPAEPVNTFSNLAIILFGIAALVIVTRRTREPDFYVLGTLLVANGVGSFLWHGLRTPWALSLDVFPGLLFLLSYAYLWSRRFFSRSYAAGLLAAFFAAEFLSMYAGRMYAGGMPFFVAGAPIIIAFGAWLTIRTAVISRRGAVFGATSLGLAVLALVFRSADAYACGVLPFGSHFLWHVSLSAGAFCGILALLSLSLEGVTAKRRRELPLDMPA